MSSFVKALLVVAGIFVLLALAAGVGGYLWFKHNKVALMENAKTVIEEGKRFGAETDNNGCLAEAVARIKEKGGFKNQIKIDLFLRGCLDASKSSPDFCNEVPPDDEIMQSVAWRLEMSRKYNLDGTKANLLQSVQKYCDECRKKAK
jgi:hypothetical protein